MLFNCSSHCSGDRAGSGTGDRIGGGAAGDAGDGDRVGSGTGNRIGGDAAGDVAGDAGGGVEKLKDPEMCK